MPKVPIRAGSNSDTIFIGVDPGVSGGLAFTSSLSQQVVLAQKMPATEKDIWTMIDSFPTLPRIRAVIELVHSSPQMGVKSAFTFGQNFGALCMALTAASIPFEAIRPSVWIQALKIPKRKSHTKTKEVQIKKGKDKGKWKVVKCGGETDTQWKNRLKKKAQQLFPKVQVTLATADAILIAEYCRRKEKGLL